MVEAMGGGDSEGFRAFCAHACEAYNILRASASLILSLFHLMAGAAIPDVRADPEKVILKLQARPLPAWHRRHALRQHAAKDCRNGTHAHLHFRWRSSSLETGCAG